MFDNSSLGLYLIAGAVILFVLGQSLFFLIKAWKHGKEMGIDKKKLKNAVTSSALFTIPSALSVLATVIALAPALGLVIPWVRLSVIGNITYETVAATEAIKAFGITTGITEAITDPEVYAGVAWVMTLGIMPSIILPPILMKKIQGGVVKLKNKDSKWGDIFMTSLFLGMISAFLGMVFADIRSGLAGFIPLFVLLFSALLMAVCGLLIKKCNMKWLETYARSISMIGAMIFAVIITPMIV